jgi:hypothetical protein
MTHEHTGVQVKENALLSEFFLYYPQGTDAGGRVNTVW